MPHVRYNGPGGVEVPNIDGEIVEVESGHQVEVSAELRDELLERGDDSFRPWSAVKDPGGAKAKAAQKEE